MNSISLHFELKIVNKISVNSFSDDLYCNVNNIYLFPLRVTCIQFFLALLKTVLQLSSLIVEKPKKTSKSSIVIVQIEERKEFVHIFHDFIIYISYNNKLFFIGKMYVDKVGFLKMSLYNTLFTTI